MRAEDIRDRRQLTNNKFKVRQKVKGWSDIKKTQSYKSSSAGSIEVLVNSTADTASRQSEYDSTEEDRLQPQLIEGKFH